MKDALMDIQDTVSSCGVRGRQTGNEEMNRNQEVEMKITEGIKSAIKSRIDFSKDKDYNINVIAGAIFNADFDKLEKKDQKQVLKYYEDHYDRKTSW